MRTSGVGIHLAALAGVGLLVALSALTASNEKRKKAKQQEIKEKHRAT